MTNAEKYASEAERIHAFYCVCTHCKIDKCDRIHAIECFNAWLSDEDEKDRGTDEIMIVPHRPPFTDATWFNVKVRRTIVKLWNFRIWMWRTVGDYPSFSSAYACACGVRSAIDFNNANSGKDKCK